MNPFDYTKALTAFWSAQTETMMKAQQEAASGLSEAWQAMAGSALPATAGTASGVDTGIPELTRASQAMLEMWSGATAFLSQLVAKLPSMASASGEGTMETVLGKIMDPSNWMAGGIAGAAGGDEMLGRMAEGPRLADLWQIERRYARVMQASMEVRRRGLDYNAVMLQAWMRAGKAFSEEMAGRASADSKPPTGKAAIALWTETANKQLIATQGTEAFLAAQREMIRANTALRMAQRELTEYFGEQYGFPTRSELDDVHRTVTELRRELRMMRRQLRSPAPVNEPAPPTTASNANDVPAKRVPARSSRPANFRKEANR